MSFIVGATARVAVISAWLLVAVGLVPSAWAQDNGPQTQHAALEGAEAAPAGSLILDQNAYWRMYYRYAPQAFAPAAVRAEGAACWGDKQLERVKRFNEALLRQETDARDWQDLARIPCESTGFTFDQLGIDLNYRLRTAPPPGDWAQPDFDDSDWPRHRLAFAMGGNVQRACLRTRFDLPDPARAGPLTLDVAFRGGVIVYVNGQEVARSHLGPLPAGELAPEIPAQGYPPEAYYRKEGEYCPAILAHADNRFEKKRCDVILAGELPPAWEKMRLVRKVLDFVVPEGERFRCENDWGTGSIMREGHARLTALRDRRLKAVIPPSALRAGANVLAIEVRRADVHPWALFWQKAYAAYYGWGHGNLLSLSLRSSPRRAAPSPTTRPAGVRLWAEDIHRRLYAKDLPDPCASSEPLRITGCRNGVFAAQAAISSDRELMGLKASLGPLKHKDGRTLPPAAAQVLYGVPHMLSELRVGDNARRIGNSPSFAVYGQFIKDRYGTADMKYFDHLSPAPPETVPADSTYPLWLSVDVPADAPPGTYAGRLSVSAEGVGDPKRDESRLGTPAALELPVELEVADWRLPPPADWATVMALEQSPYCVAEQYKAPLWSDQHWALLEKVFAQLARVDNDWLNVPVLMNTEFGNKADSMVRIIRGKDGRLRLDLAILDRYLDLAIRHCGPPAVVDFVVMHAGNPGDGRMSLSAMDVSVLDEATGQVQPMPVDHRADPEARREFWKFLAHGLFEHMKARGLEKSMYWGYTWDGPGTDPTLYALLAEFAPTVYWAKGSHAAAPNEYVRAATTAYNSQLSIWFTSKKGWKRPELWLAYPRYWGTIIDCSDYSPPFCFRLMPERALASGARGIGRVGVDYWGGTYLAGHVATYTVGVPNLFLLFAGPAGPEPGMRFALLREGLQETEARVFLEQALEKLSDDSHKELAARVQAMLDERLVETLIDSPASSQPELAELCAKGWQRRSRRLYAACAEVARLVGADLDRSEAMVELPARGSATLTLRVRNWTDQPRAFQAAIADVPPTPVDPKKPAPAAAPAPVPAEKWLSLPAAGGTCSFAGAELAVRLDASALPAGRQAQGLVVFTDQATGRRESVRVLAKVGPVFELLGAPPVMNLSHDQEEAAPLSVVNHSGRELAWTGRVLSGHPTKPDPKEPRKQVPVELGEPVEWLKLEPAAAGKIAPGQTAAIRLRARRTISQRESLPMTLVVTEEGGEKRQAPMTVHLLPPPAVATTRPAGQAVGLDALPKEAIVSHRDGRRGKAALTLWAPAEPKDKFALGKPAKVFAGGLAVTACHETVINIEGKGFKAFAAEVGPSSRLSDPVNLSWAHVWRLHFEIYVDGKLAAHSGLMLPTDAPRLLVVTGLENAKQLRLVTRSHNDQDQRSLVGCWAEPAFYR